jgi:hypothetical protein
MFQPADPCDGTFDTHPKTGMRNRSELAKIQVPSKSVLRKMVLF